ncbi:tetratricopeptide repeat protein [Pseudomonas sp. MM211]|uniref:tetratricopeptide repeat protein n=1 Tax=Pseudomonas sp. MM211 TaxID=2866808 RepID=UPI001CECFFC6|nr:tetratricopeptide repeat protein [Pseudomonas sp. MM211]UCJ16341.1 tetratricopeptide repeat protein [Pseudomonas sp. MM211]
MPSYHTALLPLLLTLTLSGCASLTSLSQPALDKEAGEALRLAHTLRDNQRFQAADEVYARMDERGQLKGSYVLEYASVAANVRPAKEALPLYLRARDELGGDASALPASQSVALCSGLGRARLALGQAALAEGDFRCATDAQPNNLQALNGLGVAYNLQKRDEDARQQFEKALAIDPGYSPALNNLALSWLASGDSSRAIGLLNQARGQGDISLQLNLALAYVFSGHEDTAKAVLLESLEADYAGTILEQFRTARARVNAGAPLASELLAASQQPLALSEQN